MSTASSFTALGAGNGFPECVSKIQSGRGSTPLIFSLAQVMEVYWLINRISSGTDTTWTQEGEQGLPDMNIRSDISETAFFAVRDNYTRLTYTPAERSCGNLGNRIGYADFGPFLWGGYSANNGKPTDSGGANMRATMGFEGGFQIVQDENNLNGKNKYGIVGDLKGFCRSKGFVLGSSEYELLQHYSTYEPDPNDVGSGSIGKISIGDFTLYSWEGPLFGGNTGLNFAIPKSENLPKISAFDKYTFT